MGRRAIQRVVTLSMAVLDSAAYGSTSRRQDTIEVRLALAVLWLVLKERRWLRAYWYKASRKAEHPWKGARSSWYGIAGSLRAGGWDAPIEAAWMDVREAIEAGPPPEHPGFDCD